MIYFLSESNAIKKITLSENKINTYVDIIYSLGISCRRDMRHCTNILSNVYKKQFGDYFIH